MLETHICPTNSSSSLTDELKCLPICKALTYSQHELAIESILCCVYLIMLLPSTFGIELSHLFSVQLGNP